ncbi:unnamed protein product [Paramecium sonneborni]|uniref:Uncharacterized protein n=1 Tax=Paramecium sonneborni TaxID=65129 RepID=A0A8S1MUQ2_9CILI|nr:unnamed protein product [Paramecium sonneborni]
MNENHQKWKKPKPNLRFYKKKKKKILNNKLFKQTKKKLILDEMKIQKELNLNQTKFI